MGELFNVDVVTIMEARQLTLSSRMPLADPRRNLQFVPISLAMVMAVC